MMKVEYVQPQFSHPNVIEANTERTKLYQIQIVKRVSANTY